jgi:hypothetical protein
MGLSRLCRFVKFIPYQIAAMNPKHFAKAAVTALVLIILFIAGLEYYWRSNGYQLSYNDDKILWADVRRQVYEPSDRATVFSGSSRIKWDIDIETWERLTGEKAIQLGLVGTSPRKVVFDLANDEKFVGKLIIDVTGVFRLDPSADLFADEALEYYHNETPAQRASAKLDFALESRLILLEEGKFGLNNLIKERSNKNRPGVRDPSLPILKEYTLSTNRRQSKFSPLFENSPQLQKGQIERWAKRNAANQGRVRFASESSLDSLMMPYKIAFDKIRSRGGTVVWVQLPITGNFLAQDKRVYPREKFWDRLLQVTNTPGIHYADYPETAGLPCIEESHLSSDNSIKYTISLVKTLSTEYGWKFPSNHP